MTTFLVLTALDTLLLWVLAGTKGGWVPKAVAIVAALTVNVVLLVPHIPSGLPTTGDPPERAELVACLIAEPDAIYLWLRTGGEPRAFRQPYTRELHELCEAARKAGQQGVRFGLRRVKGRPGVTGQQIPKWAFRRYVLPPARPPSKEQ